MNQKKKIYLHVWTVRLLKFNNLMSGQPPFMWRTKVVKCQFLFPNKIRPTRKAGMGTPGSRAMWDWESRSTLLGWKVEGGGWDWKEAPEEQQESKACVLCAQDWLLDFPKHKGRGEWARVLGWFQSWTVRVVSGSVKEEGSPRGYHSKHPVKQTWAAPHKPRTPFWNPQIHQIWRPKVFTQAVWQQNLNWCENDLKFLSVPFSVSFHIFHWRTANIHYFVVLFHSINFPKS